MYTPGKLIYFKPFYFNNNKPSKPKYFLVLEVIGKDAVVVSLPTSVIQLPSHLEINHGCLEIPDACINCYIFKSNIPITKCGWSFKFDTLLHGTTIEDYEISKLNAQYVIAGVDYEIIGELTDIEFSNLLMCFAKSNTIKRKYKKMFTK